MKYTDIENINNYPDTFKEGEPVIVTEKVEGCFRADQKVMLANGEYELISNIKHSDAILSYDKNSNTFVPKTVKRVISNKKNKKWIKLCLDNGKEIICTADHEFLTSNRGWVNAENLTEQDNFIEVIYSPIII